jgi:membrane-bound lytic murein transglycosylase A
MAVSDRGDWLRGVDLNHRPLGYEPNELPDCSTPHEKHNTVV